jgi:alkanesulfonate monooxygenase
VNQEPLELHWLLMAFDGTHPWRPEGRRAVDFNYLKQLAGAIDHVGFTGALLATNVRSSSTVSHDAWMIAASLIPATHRMKFIIAVHSGIVAPTMLAQMAATFDQFSNGRLILNIVSGDGNQLAPYGIYADHDTRYEIADEYWSVWRRLMCGEAVDFEGRHISLKGAELDLQPVQKPYPSLHLGGSSDAALSVAAKHADTYLTWGEPPPLAGAKIAKVKKLAAAQGRKLRYGVRLHLILRETRQEAWDQAQWFLDRIDDQSIEARRAWTQASDSVGQMRMNAVIGERVSKRARDLEIYPDLWSGFGLIRRGPGTAIVGDPQTVAARIREYRDVGFDTFIFSAHPLLEEVYRVADLLFPALGFPAGRKPISQSGALVALPPPAKSVPG